jgi:hypothetical protein
VEVFISVNAGDLIRIEAGLDDGRVATAFASIFRVLLLIRQTKFH